MSISSTPARQRSASILSRGSHDALAPSPLQHPLVPVFAPALESLCTALTFSSKRNYDIVVRGFLVYLGTRHPRSRASANCAAILTSSAG